MKRTMDKKKAKSLMKNILANSDVLQESLSMEIADQLTKNDVFIQTVVSKLYEHIIPMRNLSKNCMMHCCLTFYKLIANLKNKLSKMKKK